MNLPQKLSTACVLMIPLVISFTMVVTSARDWKINRRLLGEGLILVGVFLGIGIMLFSIFSLWSLFSE